MNRTELLLVCLAEECAQVQHAIAKTLRFSFDDTFPGVTSANAQDIVSEFTDVLAVMELLEDIGTRQEAETLTNKRRHDSEDRALRLAALRAIERKKAQISEYLSYVEQCKTLKHNMHLGLTT
jgi:hypothetical protein